MGVILEVKYNQIGDFHSGELPPEEERERLYWGSRYANVNIEDIGGVQNRAKFDIDIFDDMRELIDSGVGTPVIAHVNVDKQYQSIRVHFAVNIESLRTKIRGGSPLDVWESVVTGAHPALTYPWKSGHVKFKVGDVKKRIDRRTDAVKNILWRKRVVEEFTGLVTHIRRKIDKKDNEMAFFGMLDGNGRYLDAICFGSQWPSVKKYLRAGRLIQISLEPAETFRGRRSYLFNGHSLRLLNKTSGS